MNALYGDSWFSHQSPNDRLVDMITGGLIIVAPLFWFSFMGSMGIGIGNLASLAAASLNNPGEESAKKGAEKVQTAGKAVASIIKKGI